MNKLLEQIIKFGLVGALCFVIDFAVTMGLTVFGINHLTAAFFGFVISVIVNYLLSFKFVFQRKEHFDRRKEFVIFLVLSIIGLGINEILIYLSVDILYEQVILPDQNSWLNRLLTYELAVAAGKVFATGVVMVYNFVTRKIFLEQKETKPVS
ncbi:MAG: GtrA family protein [Lachnospiraceae bacterium]|nr:GtrA family protein [Lachnospiraceae bacterium]